VKILLLETAAGYPTEFDNSWVVEYDPSVRNPDGSYDGGLLRTTKDISEAREFASPEEAFAYWRQEYGLRPDGRPNRPLTAWTVEVSR
jgi:hypothetical protein